MTDDALWVTAALDGTLERIDPGSGRVTARVPVGGFPIDVAAAAGDLWVIDGASGRTIRVRA